MYICYTPNTLEEYKKEKLSVLKDFCIRLNKTEKEHLHSLPSEIAVDNYVHTLIMERL